jgi:hypothetical protein
LPKLALRQNQIFSRLPVQVFCRFQKIDGGRVVRWKILNHHPLHPLSCRIAWANEKAAPGYPVPLAHLF